MNEIEEVEVNLSPVDNFLLLIKLFRTFLSFQSLLGLGAYQPNAFFVPINILLCLGHGVGQVVTVLAFYSDYPSSNPAEAIDSQSNK